MSENFPEAGAVINVDYKRTDGFVIKLTLRDVDGKTILERLEGALTKIKEQGGVPYERSSSFPKKQVSYVEGRVCPKDSGKLIKPEPGTKKPIKCENNKYDWATKTASGCQYIEWPDQQIPERQIKDY